MLVGANLAWCHPVLHQRIMAAKAARGTQIIVIDPRRTATCEGADLHLALTPGADGHLFNLLLIHLADQGHLNTSFLPHLTGLDETLTAARTSTAADTGLAPHDLSRFLHLWAQTERTVTVFSQGINQSDTGTDKVNAILNCHLATGRIGRPGMGPFSITGQPNAMGGREVGGLANMLACHLEIENPTHRAAVQGFWASPFIPEKPGLKAVDMFRAVESGQIKALWMLCTNPAVSMPDATRVARAIAACDFTVVSDMWADTDTARLAHVLLPAAGWGEKDGTVTNSDRTISRQRATLPPPGQARPDWWALAQVGRRLGGEAAFSWPNPAAIWREHAALSGVAGTLGSDFDISDHATLSDTGYEKLTPFTWPLNPRRNGGRFFADGQFHTPDGRARMIPVIHAAALTPTHPFRLNTGRIRDQWHTMSRTGQAPRLSAHLAEPYLEIHPDDAARAALAPATLAQITNDHGRAILRVMLSDRVREGHPFAPIHWTANTAPSGLVNALVPGLTDPHSGQPASKSAPVAIAPFAATWYGYAISAGPVTPDCAYWARARLARGWQVEMAGDHTPEDWATEAARLFVLPPPDLTVSDPKRGVHRFAFLRDGRLIAALFIAPTPVALSRSHMATLLGVNAEHALLSGWPGADRPDPGPTVCACLNVGAASIARAIADQGLITVDAIGHALRAGTNCGSCRPEIAQLIARHTPLREAAE